MVQDDVSHRKVGWNLRSGFYRVCGVLESEISRVVSS